MKTLAAAIRAADHLAKQTGKNFHVIKVHCPPTRQLDTTTRGMNSVAYLAVSRERLHSRLPGLTEASPELLHSTACVRAARAHSRPNRRG